MPVIGFILFLVWLAFWLMCVAAIGAVAGDILGFWEAVEFV